MEESETMKSWKKENKIMMKVNYYTSETHDNNESFVEHWLEGQRIFLNFPDAVEFITVMDKSGECHSIAKRNVNRIVYKNIPKEFVLSEKITMESAKLRMDMLELDLVNQRKHLTQETAVENLKDNGEVGSVR